MGAGLGMLGAVGGMMQNMTSPYMNGMGAMTGIPQPMAGQMMAGMQGGAGQTMDGMQNGAGQTMDGMQGGAGQTMAGGMQSGAGQTMDGMQGGAGQTMAGGMQNGAGQMAAVSAADPVEVLGKLKRLLEAGLIEQEEYDAKKQEILANL